MRSITSRDLASRFRMPVVFGPSPGPRQGPSGERFDYSEARRTTASVSFLTDAVCLAALLPPKCELDGEPVVTVEHTKLHALEWLAGRGYSMLAIKFPVSFAGVDGPVRGSFLPVLWENMAEPIISGREELGFAKLYCELPPPRTLRSERRYSARWDGHEFARLTLSAMSPGQPPAAPQPGFAGTLHHRYAPGLDDTRDGAVDQMVMTPAGGFTITYDRVLRGDGTVEFARSDWTQLPTMHHIVNALADLPAIAWRGAALIESRGAKDLSDQRILR